MADHKLLELSIESVQHLHHATGANAMMLFASCHELFTDMISFRMNSMMEVFRLAENSCLEVKAVERLYMRV